MAFLLCALTVLVIFSIALKIFLKLWVSYNGSYTCLVGKTAIVTGANTGIGYVTALDFAKRGARVILACKNEDRAEKARRKIIEATSNPNVVYKLLDTASFSSVRKFAKDINATEDRLDILVNNAGAGGLGNRITTDGLQITMQINHLSAFLLTHLLLDKLKKSAPSRIVNVASMAAKYAKFDINKINEYPEMGETRAETLLYCNSKLCNILFTTELAKKIQESGVTANTLHPGTIYTDIYRRMPPLLKKFWTTMAELYFKTPEEGAQTTIYVSVSKDLQSVTGKLFEDCREITVYNIARDEDLAQKLWQKCEELTKLTNKEKIK